MWIAFFLPKDEPPLNLLGASVVEPGKANYDPELTGMGVELQHKSS